MQRVQLTVHSRNETGKGPMRRLRSQGNIPTVLYGLKRDPFHGYIVEQDFIRAHSKIAEGMVLYDLNFEGDAANNLAVIRATQRDPVTEAVLHIDMLRVDLNQPIDVDVAIHTVGEPKGADDGGVLEQPLWNLSLRCKPNDVPASIEVDVSGMEVNDTFHVSDLAIPEGVEILTDPDESVCTVAIPKRIVEPEEGEEAELLEGEEAEGEEGEEAEGEEDGEES